MKELLKRYDNYALSVSMTTRAPREGEVDGESYFFVDKETFERTIEEDGLKWTQVSDLKFWQSEVGQLYNVSFIPQNVFVDAEGNIIGRKVEEEDIVPLLDEYLK